MTRPAPRRGRSTPEVTPNPERLTEGKFGLLLKEGSRELADGLDQAAAFQRLTERLSPSRALPRLYWLAPAVILVLAVFAVLPTLLRRSSSATLIVAEDLRGQRKRTADDAGSPAEATKAPPVPFAPQRADGRSASVAKHSTHGPSASASVSRALPVIAEPAPEPQPLRMPPPDTSSAAPSAPPRTSEVGIAPDCLSLARGGQTRDAEACFLKRAEGSGLGAEMALYEVARLRRDVLGDATGALRALAEYRTRFPAGSLRREADMSQLELLVQLGRSDEALRQSEALLSSSAGGERAAELHLLRGHILRKTRSFAAAAHEYELAESAGRRGDVIYFHALCLEALGRGPEAATLLSRYLEQSQHSYVEDARRRLERLKQ